MYPFNPVTRISYSLPVKSEITLKLFDITGNELLTLVTGVFEIGEYTFDFNAASLSSGVYYYRLQGENFSDTKKMVLVK